MILSAVGNTAHAPDDRLVLATTLLGADIPDYGLTFQVVDAYHGDEFAFDQCDDPATLIPGKLIDQEFLVSRYERLFKYPATPTPRYYLVPWMGLPAKRLSTTAWQLVDNLYLLKVSFLDVPNLAGARQRKLRLVPSASNITANWQTSMQAASPKPDELDVPDVTVLTDEVVELIVADGPQSETGSYLEIKEVNSDGSNGKTVGKLRFLLLEMLPQRVFLIKVTENGQHYDLDRILSAATAPVALECFPGQPHRSIIDEANDFGFKQIGLSLQVAGPEIDLCNSNGDRLFFDTDDFPKTYKIDKDDITDELGFVIPGPTADNNYEKYLIDILFKDTAYLRDINSSLRSRYSALYIFFTEFPFYGTLGISYGEIAIEPDDVPKKKTSAVASLTDTHNVTLFYWMFPEVNFPVGTTQWDYDTLTHESSHALFVNHYFDDKIPASDFPIRRKLLEYYAEAHTWLRLCLHDDYDEKAVLRVSGKKVRIDDFKTTGTKTMFDEIIAQGMSPAIEAFVDSKVFPGAARPSQWTTAELLKSSTKMPITDLKFWISLNDLIKFKKYKSKNTMDYQKYGAKWVLDPVTNQPRLPRSVIRFNRFQWELMRTAVRRLNQLTYQP